MISPRLLSLALIVAGSVIIACAGRDDPEPVATAPRPQTPAPAAVQIEDAACQFDPPPGQDPARVRCGYAVVPEDRSRPEGRAVRLAFAVLKTDAAEPLEPILFLDGGPGGSTLEGTMQWFSTPFARPLQSRHDLVFFDYRGTGLSEPDMSCLAYGALFQQPPPNNEQEREALRRQGEATLFECRDRITEEGTDLNAYNSQTIAADGADLVRGLGFERYSLYGVSYGTRVALTMMREQPAGIERVILDSTDPPQADLYSQPALNLQHSLERIFEQCRADPDCDAAYPDLEERLFALERAADDDPLPVSYLDPESGETRMVELNGGRFLSAVFQYLYSTERVAELPYLVHVVEQGDYSLLQSTVSYQYGKQPRDAIAMRQSTLCAEEVPFLTEDAVEATQRELEPELIEAGYAFTAEDLSEERALCERWGVDALGPKEDAAVRSDLPALILAGEFDPITPSAWGRLAAESLPNSVFVELPATGHGALFQVEHACAMSLVEAFLDGEPIDDRRMCAADMGGIDFRLP